MTLTLSNWSSHRSPGHHGPGRTLCGMTAPRSWEKGDGRVFSVAPDVDLLHQVKRGEIGHDLYFERYAHRLAHPGDEVGYGPGQLRIHNPGDTHPWGDGRVADGDTICCACARPGSPKRTHPCHLEWLAPHLVRAGWETVVLYGRELVRGAICGRCGLESAATPEIDRCGVCEGALSFEGDHVWWSNTGERYTLPEVRGV